MKDDFFVGWNKIDNNTDFSNYYRKIERVDYFNSLIYAQYSNLYYKIVGGWLFIAKPIFNFNNYLFTISTKPISLNENDKLDYSDFLSIGVSIKGEIQTGKKDAFGKQYIYDCDDFLSLKGSRYTKHRNRMKFFFNNLSDFNVVYGHNEDIFNIIDSWECLKKSKTQKKLYKIALNNLDKCTITTTYYKGVPLGFSIVETINDRNGIIIQRLINYDCNFDGEANFILQYNDCLIHKGKRLNIGGSRNDGIDVAKEKLKPIDYLIIKKLATKVKLDRSHYLKIKS